MKKLLLILPFLACLNCVMAQGVDTDGTELIKKCTTSEMYLKLLEDHPELVQNIRENEIAQDHFIRQYEQSAHSKDGDTYLIPVVFHVIHNYGSENISNEQIYDAIRVMNEDFSAQNSSAAFVHPAFADLVADTHIQFALARRDAEGNCTNGILRSVSTLTYQGSDNLKELSPAWDRSMYLNIWVCRTIESGAAGYSRYPGSVNSSFGALIDGIVVRSDYVGSIGSSSLGRSHTLTHEAGHYLNLPHLWGSTNEPGMAENCQTDDGVADTPNTIGWTECPVGGESCGSADNIENFMEYSYCSKMFTQGQALRMTAALNSSVAQRSNLWQPANLLATGVTEDAVACMADFTSSRRTICVGETVSFLDLSYNGIINREWTFEGGQPATAQGAAPVVMYPSPGVYEVNLIAGDGINEVSTVKTDYIRVLDTAYSAVPFTESFETTPPLDSGADNIWFTESIEEGMNWEISDEAGSTGSRSAWFNGFANSGRRVAFLSSRTFDASALDSTAVLSCTFKYACARKGWSGNDRLRVWISKDCGQNWNLRTDLSGDELYTVPGEYSGAFFPTEDSQWKELNIDGFLTFYNTTSFRMRFEFISDGGNNMFVDDINLFDISTGLRSIDKDLRDLVAVYPNPARDHLTIALGGEFSGMQVSVSLYDLPGRRIKPVFSGTAGDELTLTVDLNGLAGGMYILHFATPAGSFAKKFTITR